MRYKNTSSATGISKRMAEICCKGGDVISDYECASFREVCITFKYETKMRDN